MIHKSIELKVNAMNPLPPPPVTPTYSKQQGQTNNNNNRDHQQQQAEGDRGAAGQAGLLRPFVCIVQKWEEDKSSTCSN